MKKITILYLVLLIFMIISCGDQVNDSNSESGNRKTDQSDTKIEDNLLTNEDLDSLNSVDLLLLRNDIFAKHGYSFKTKPLRDYYSQFEWYNPEYDNVDSLLTEEDQKNLKLIQEYEEHFKSKEADFKKLLSQFYQAEDNTFEIFRDFEDNYSFFEGEITDAFLTEFFNINVDKFGKDCGFLRLFPILKFNVPNSYNIAVVTGAWTCPTPAVYCEYGLWVFDPYGNIIDFNEIGYARGGGGELYNASSLFKDDIFIKTLTFTYDDYEAETIVNETTKYEISFEPITSKIIETEL